MSSIALYFYLNGCFFKSVAQKRKPIKRYEHFTMISENYIDYIYKVDGEELSHKPEEIFDSNDVYLIVDKPLELIWIWAGKKSKLFQRYMAASWAGKLKSRKKFYNYEYELVKEGKETRDFLYIFNEIREGRDDLNYPGQSRGVSESRMSFGTKNTQKGANNNLSGIDKTQIRKMLNEITEIVEQVKFTLKHVQKKMGTIKKMIK